MATAIRLYLDENISPSVARQIEQRGVFAVSVRDLGVLGDSDINHLRRATELACVLCTHDSDYLVLAAQGVPHAGIIYAQQTSTLVHGCVV